jgi:hypothetical protein
MDENLFIAIFKLRALANPQSLLVEHPNDGLRGPELILRLDYGHEFNTTSRNHHVSGDSHGGVQSFFTYLHAVLPCRIREELTKQLSSPNATPLGDMLEYAVHSCLNQTGSEWLQSQEVQSTNHGGSAFQRSDVGLSSTWSSYANTASSGFDHGLSCSDLGLEDPTPWDLNEMPMQTSTWSAPFENRNAELASTNPGMPSYGGADMMECSEPSSSSVGFPWGSDTAQWSSGDPHDIIVLD